MEPSDPCQIKRLKLLSKPRGYLVVVPFLNRGEQQREVFFVFAAVEVHEIADKNPVKALPDVLLSAA